MRTCIIPLVAIAAAAFLAAAAPVAAIYGGWEPIPDVKDPRVQEVGAWAVAEHDKRANDGLRFREVVGGEMQVVAGLNYRLDIVAVNLAGQNVTYDAVVYEGLTSTRRLLAFDPAN